MNGSTADEMWTCLIDPVDYDGRANHKLEIVGLTDEEIAGLVTGVTYMTAVGATIDGRTIDVSGVVEKSFETTTPTDKDNEKVLGARTVLGIRVKSADGANPMSQSDLQKKVFTENINLAERFASCSYNKLILEPFSGNMNGVSIPGGIYEVTIAQKTSSQTPFDVQGWVIDKLNVNLGNNFLSQIDHLMIFMPSNVQQFVAYAEMTGKVSAFNGFVASYASQFFVHEIAHNFNLHHSGIASASSAEQSEYGDVTCSLGYGINSDDHEVCFNPPKSWALGWYEDKHVTLNLGRGAVEEISLVGIAEYNIAGSNNAVLVKFVNGGLDYFIGFNRAIGINADQFEAVDQVTVTRSPASNQISTRLAALSSGQSFDVAGIVIEVLSIDVSSRPGVAVMKITNTNTGGGGGGGGGSICFSGENLVTVLGKGNVRLDSLTIGDYVRTSERKGAYTRVYGFLHWQRQLAAEFLKFTFRNASSLELEVSPKHLLYSNGRTIAAGTIRVGDFLDGEDGEVLFVLGIETVQRYGVYAPATESGNIIVSGVRSSNYVNLLHTSAMDHHIMSHAFLAPIRFICKLNFDWCRQQTYTEEGYSHWVKFFIGICDILNQCWPGVQYVTTLLISPIAAFLMVCDIATCERLVAVGLSIVACGCILYRP